jgi:hypothetical protein
MSIISTVAAVMLMAGAATALAQSPSQTNPRDRSDTEPTAQPTLSPSAKETHNPLVNPSAAATQNRWKGYGASSSAVSAHRVGSDNSARHIGLDDPGSVTPGAGMPLTAPSPSPPAARASNPGEARERLKQLGYSHVVELQQVGRSGWEAVARRDNREVRVSLDTEGTVTAEHTIRRAR